MKLCIRPIIIFLFVMLCVVFISRPTLAENVVTFHPMTFFWMSLIILIITTDNINKDGLVSLEPELSNTRRLM